MSKRIHENALKKVQEGSFYEAVQLYKTLLARYTASRKFDDALALIEQGCQSMLRNDQQACGSELAALYVDTLNTAKQPLTAEIVDSIIAIFKQFSPGQHRLDFMKAAIKWSAKFGSNKNGEPLLHQTAAEAFLKHKEFAQAHKHFLRSDSPVQHSLMLMQWAQEGLPSERDLFIARAVLEYLCLENLDGANQVFESYQRRYALTTPLTNFIRFLLVTLERDLAPVFQVLLSKYQVSIDRDPTYLQYLDKIGQVYFGLKPAVNSLQSMLGELFAGST